MTKKYYFSKLKENVGEEKYSLIWRNYFRYYYHGKRIRIGQTRK